MQHEKFKNNNNFNITIILALGKCTGEIVFVKSSRNIFPIPAVWQLFCRLKCKHEDLYSFQIFEYYAFFTLQI